MLLAVTLVAAFAWYHFAFEGFVFEGRVLDASTEQPLAGALVVAGADSATTVADGTFRLQHVKPPEAIGVTLPGYVAATARPLLPGQPLLAKVDPVTLDVVVLDADSGEPVVDADVRTQAARGQIVSQGRYRVGPMRPEDRVAVSAAGYTPRDVPYRGESSLEVTLPISLVGHVTNAATGKPVANAVVQVGGTAFTTGADGSYEVAARPTQGHLVALVPGFKRADLDLATTRGLDVRLQPNEVKALYMTHYAIGLPDARQHMLKLLETTELNAVVIDVKGDRGTLSYRSDVPLAEKIGANRDVSIQDVRALLESIHSRGGYAIARIVVFKDDLLARNGTQAGVDVAIRDARTGEPWVDGEDLAWVDAFRQPAWDYNVALAQEAIARGFDEVQFDYIRFPTDPAAGSSVDDASYSKPFTAANRVEALRSFLALARDAVHRAGGFLAIDTFGYSPWWEGDGGIGQQISVLADDVDYLCPMIYPSTFEAGVPGGMVYPSVVKDPHEVVYETLAHLTGRMSGKQAVVRPWLQYFDDYPWATGFKYDAAQVEAQKKAVGETGALGWMLWGDPSTSTTRGGLAPKR